MPPHPLPALSLLECRVLGVLIEKQHTVPDTYPLSLNALLAGCNQKSSRDPVLIATESEVQSAVDQLKYLSLVMEGSGNRVTRYEHNSGRVLQLPSQSVALLATLMLRGAQTPGELRINCECLYKFSDISSVEVFLNELRERVTGALVAELPRKPGSRENRWVHLLCGVPAAEMVSVAAETTPGADVTVSELAALKANVARLEDEVAQLKATMSSLCKVLGVTQLQ